jgi:hypothetical protein
MVRLLLEDVTLNRGEQITLQIRFKGGAHKTLNLPLPLCGWQQRVTPPSVIGEIDRLLNEHTPAQIADILKERGITSGAGASFHPQLVARLARNYHLKPRSTARARDADVARDGRRAASHTAHGEDLVASRFASRARLHRQERIAVRAATR